MRRFVLLLLVIACGSSKPAPQAPVPAPPPPDPIPATAGPPCDVVAKAAVPVMFADKPDAHAQASEVLRTRCQDDAWGDEARNCMATAQSDDELAGCSKLLTDAQRTALDDATAAL